MTTRAHAFRPPALPAPLHAHLEPAQSSDDDQQRHNLQHAERRDRAVAAALFPHGEADGAEHAGARPDQEHRGAELAHREDEDVDPGREQKRQDQRKQHAQENLAERRAGDRRRLLKLAMDLRDAARGKAHAVGQAQRHVGDEQDPDRVVDGIGTTR